MIWTFERLNHLFDQLIFDENNFLMIQNVNILEYNKVNQAEDHINMEYFDDLNVIIFLIHLKIFLYKIKILFQKNLFFFLNLFWWIN